VSAVVADFFAQQTGTDAELDFFHSKYLFINLPCKLIIIFQNNAPDKVFMSLKAKRY
jgi:hypothetical protein